MTNDDLKRELSLIHFSLTDLKELCSKDGMEAVHLDSFVHLIEERFSDLHSNLVSVLNVYELVEITRSEGQEAGQAFADKLNAEETPASVTKLGEE